MGPTNQLVWKSITQHIFHVHAFYKGIGQMSFVSETAHNS